MDPSLRSPPVIESLVQSPPHKADEAVTGSAEEQTAPPKEGKPLVDEAVTGSPVRSPPRSAAAAEETKAGVPRAPRSTTVRSPSRSAENHTAAAAEETKAGVPRAPRSTTPPRSPERHAAAAGSPVRSPVRSAEDRTAAVSDTRAIVPQASSLRHEAATGSPARSPARSAEGQAASPMVPRASSMRNEAVIGSPKYEKTNSFYSVSSSRSPLHDEENPSSSPARGAMTVASILGSPYGDVTAEDQNPIEKVASPMVPMANRMIAKETDSTAKIGGRGGLGRGLMRVEVGLSRQPSIRLASIGLRIAALVLSMISFSVMAADKTYGWDGDSFDRYGEFRYCLSINVFVFVYSVFQVIVHLLHKINKRRVMSRPVSYSIDFLMDQSFAYLLMSASSSAASRNGDWVSDFGNDHFTKMIGASISMSFLAFFALALSSLISAYKFFSFKY